MHCRDKTPARNGEAPVPNGEARMPTHAFEPTPPRQSTLLACAKKLLKPL